MKSTEINEINNNLGLMVNNKGILKDIVIISMINEINVVENVSFILSKSLKRERISPDFLVSKKTIGNFNICSIYEILRTKSILNDIDDTKKYLIAPIVAWNSIIKIIPKEKEFRENIELENNISSNKYLC